MKTIKRQILEFINEELELDINREEVIEFEDQLNSENDFYIEIDGNEYRVINADAIWDIFVDEIQQTVEECYLNGADLDKFWWIELDWEKTAKNCLDADGYGHHFSSYDGSELEYTFGEEDYYIFRTN
jgi:RNAse (barnase) inhibitor barstar